MIERSHVASYHEALAKVHLEYAINLYQHDYTDEWVRIGNLIEEFFDDTLMSAEPPWAYLDKDLGAALAEMEADS